MQSNVLDIEAIAMATAACWVLCLERVNSQKLTVLAIADQCAQYLSQWQLHSSKSDIDCKCRAKQLLFRCGSEGKSATEMCGAIADQCA